MQISLLVLVLLHPFVMILCHWALIRLRSHASPQRQFFLFNFAFQLVWVIGGAWLLTCQLDLMQDWALWAYLLIYSQGVTYAYFHVLNMSETARRIKMLLMIRRGEFEQDVTHGYDAASMIQARLERLTEMQQIEPVGDGRFRIRQRFLLRIAQGFRLYKLLLGIAPRG